MVKTSYAASLPRTSSAPPDYVGERLCLSNGDLTSITGRSGPIISYVRYRNIRLGGGVLPVPVHVWMSALDAVFVV
jgi:hypothetical protein